MGCEEFMSWQDAKSQRDSEIRRERKTGRDLRSDGRASGK